MLYLKNVSLNDLDSYDITGLAEHFGCDLECPSIGYNKYCLDEDNEKFLEEQKTIFEDWEKRFDKYMEDIIQWLYDHDYLEDKEE